MEKGIGFLFVCRVESGAIANSIRFVAVMIDLQQRTSHKLRFVNPSSFSLRILCVNEILDLPVSELFDPVGEIIVFYLLCLSWTRERIQGRSHLSAGEKSP